MKKLLAALGFVILLVSISATAQPAPSPPLLAPVRINVPNRIQETPVWCWVAVSQQVIEWSKGSSPPQCALVASANNVPPAMCCDGPHPECVRTGTMPQIQTLIATYGGHASHVIQPSLDPVGLYVYLAQGKPIILQIRTNPAATHVVVLVGISFMRSHLYGSVAYLQVNDPMSIYPFPVLYQTIYPSIVNALVID